MALGVLFELLPRSWWWEATSTTEAGQRVRTPGGRNTGLGGWLWIQRF